MCVDIAWPNASVPADFERGRPMSLFRGAMAKVILANLTNYQLKTVALNHLEDLRASGLGKNWNEFRAQMMRIAKQGYAITRAEMIPHAGGISALISSPEQKVIGSITFVISIDKWTESDFDQVGAWITQAAAQVTQDIAEQEKSSREANAKRMGTKKSPMKKSEVAGAKTPAKTKRKVSERTEV